MNRLNGTNHYEMMKMNSDCATMMIEHSMSCYATEMTVTKTIDCCWSWTEIVTMTDWTIDFDYCCSATNVKKTAE
jgi:hypothetical protein